MTLVVLSLQWLFVGDCGPSATSVKAAPNRAVSLIVTTIRQVQRMGAGDRRSGNAAVKRINKAIFPAARNVGRRLPWFTLYHWAEGTLYECRTIDGMPGGCCRRLYNASVWLIESGRLQRLPDRDIHIIPYHVQLKTDRSRDDMPGREDESDKILTTERQKSFIRGIVRDMFAPLPV